MAAENKKVSAVIGLTEPPPQYTLANSSSNKTRRTTVALTVYSGTVTTIVVAMAIFGGLFYHHTMKTCVYEEETNPALLERKEEVREYGHRQVVKETELDYQKEVEVMRFTSPGADVDGSVMVIDYRRSVSGLYIPLTDVCYIIGGVDHHLTSPFQEMNLDAADYNDTAADGNDETHEGESKGQAPASSPEGQESTLYYRKADDYPAVDTSILPLTLRPHCQGKPIYWLERTSKPEVGISKVRVRRGWGWSPPKIKLPKIKLPKIELPKIELPKIVCCWVTRSCCIPKELCTLV